MNVNLLSNISTSQHVSKQSGSSSKGKWNLSDSLKDKINQLAQEDAIDATYMGDKYKSLVLEEVAKVAPNRSAAIAKATSMMNNNDNIQSGKAMREADNRWIRMLTGLPYKAEFETGALGTGAHIFDENGDEIATFTPGVGWQTCSSKDEIQVYDSMKFAYYDAYHETRESMKSNNTLQVDKPVEDKTSNSIYNKTAFDIKA